MLDPRTKTLRAYPKDDRKKIWAALHIKGMEHCQLPGGILEVEQQEVLNNTNMNEGGEAPANPKFSDLDELLDLGDESDKDEARVGTLHEEEDAVANITRKIEDEIIKYRQMPLLPLRENGKDFTDPLPWWKKNQVHFPILACLARKYLCIPATEAPSERIFSTASLLLSKFRNRIDPELAGRMIFIKKKFQRYEEFLQKQTSEEE